MGLGGFVLAGTDTAGRTWFVARTRPNQEKWAAENCTRQGAIPYLPTIAEKITTIFRSGRIQVRTVLRPLFPGYLFVNTDGQWRFLLSTFGLIDVIRSGEYPSTLHQSIIDELRRRESGGVVQLPEPDRLYHSDDPVRPKEGPFTGYHGLVAGYSAAERVQVLLDFLGRKVMVLFDEGQLEPV